LQNAEKLYWVLTTAARVRIIIQGLQGEEGVAKSGGGARLTTKNTVRFTHGFALGAREEDRRITLERMAICEVCQPHVSILGNKGRLVEPRSWDRLGAGWASGVPQDH
jgi:hypothetical protein